jgi:colanic acid biosynthesis protein WcaH
MVSEACPTNPREEASGLDPEAVHKGERLSDAVDRIARDELGLRVTTERRLGVHEHFWDTASVEGADSRHTVNVVFQVRPEGEFAVTLDDQHDDWRLLAAPEPDLHEYVREYLEAYDLL